MIDNFPLNLHRSGPSIWIAPGAFVIGKVVLLEQSSVWFNAVLRGDTELIQVGRRSNVQDLALLHADPGFPCTLGDGVTIGHGAIVHGATIADNVLIGMRAVVMNGAVVSSDSIVGAGAVVSEGTVIPPGSLVLGVPGRIKRETTAEEREYIRFAASHYVGNAGRFLSQFFPELASSPAETTANDSADAASSAASNLPSMENRESR